MDTTQIAMPCFFLTFQSSKLISDMSFESILTSIYWNLNYSTGNKEFCVNYCTIIIIIICNYDNNNKQI